jgi:hypothetical protein
MAQLRPGDVIYYAVTAITPKSLVLSQLVAYKKIPLDQFAP